MTARVDALSRMTSAVYLYTCVYILVGMRKAGRVRKPVPEIALAGADHGSASGCKLMARVRAPNTGSEY